MKVALVCDWLTNVGGAEKVLLEIHKLYPTAPIYTSQYDPKGIDWFKDADVRTGKLQKCSVGMRRFLGPLRRKYFENLDLSEYDLVISVTGAEAKAVKAPNGIHISYCHVPTQYYWQMYDEYIKNPGFGMFNSLVRLGFRILVRPLRRADLKMAQAPDKYITISKYAKEQIKKTYGREATVINPPVEFSDFKIKSAKSQIGDYYIVTARQVNWKKLDLAIKACMMTQRSLLVIGDGPEHKKLVKLAKGFGKVKFLPQMDKKELAKYLREAKGYLFPSLEPFGIAPVEALAAGCPVIAFKEGGSRDYIKDGKNGIFFDEQTTTSLAEAILRFEKKKFDRKKVSESVENFTTKRFDKELMDFIKDATKKS